MPQLNLPSDTDHEFYRKAEKILNEDKAERFERFGQIIENAYNNWDLSDRDLSALRTANAELCHLKNLAEIAWTIIANAGGGDWSRESDQWQASAKAWRDEWHKTLDPLKDV